MHVLRTDLLLLLLFVILLELENQRKQQLEFRAY